MAKQVRWKCANCNHGLLAPMKPRKNDVRRYCLPCSAKTGKLVERVSPTLEKQRETKSTQRKVKTQKTKTKTNAKTKLVREKKSAVKKRQAMIEKEGQRIWKLMEGIRADRCPRSQSLTHAISVVVVTQHIGTTKSK